MGSLKVVPLLSVAQTTLEEFARDCQDAWLDHHPTFTRHMGLVEESFAIADSDRLLAISPLRRYRNGATYFLTGPTIAFHEFPSPRLAGLAREAIANACAGANASALMFSRPPEVAPSYLAQGYDPVIDTLSLTENYPWAESIFATQARSVVLDLHQGVERITSQYSENHRRALRKSQKVDDLRFQVSANSTLTGMIAEAIAIHEETFERTGTRKYDPPIWAKVRELCEQGHATVANLYRQEVCVASVVCLSFKNSLRYQYGGCSSDGLNWGAYVRLHTEVIDWAIGRGFGTYNLGTYFPALRDHKMRSIGEFKRRFGGTAKPLHVGVFYYRPYRALLMGYLAQSFRSRLSRGR